MRGINSSKILLPYLGTFFKLTHPAAPLLLTSLSPHTPLLIHAHSPLAHAERDQLQGSTFPFHFHDSY
jgi:hypothetical protein